MNSRSPFKALVASFTVFVFFTTSLGINPNAFAAATALPSGEVSLPYQAALDRDLAFSLPAELGKLEYYKPGKGPMLVHIQTAHGHYEAQQQIRKILHHLGNQYGIKTLLLEGSASELSPEFLDFFPKDRKLTQKIADVFTKHALVTGEELYLLDKNMEGGGRRAEGVKAKTPSSILHPLSAPAVQALGIENLKSYLSNGESFAAALSEKQKTGQFLKTFDEGVRRLSAPYLSNDLRGFLDNLKNFESKLMGFTAWLDFLKTNAKKHLRLDLTSSKQQIEWPMLLRVFKVQEFAAKLDRQKLPKECDAFLKVLKRFVAPALYAEVENLLKHENQSVQLPDPETSLLVEDMVRQLPRDFNYDAFPNVRFYLGTLLLQSELKADRLNQEVEALSDRVAEKLAITAEEKELIALFKDYRLLEKLFALELASADYDRLLERQGTLRPSKLAGRFLEINKSRRVRDIAFEHLSEIDSLFEKSLKFYEGAKTRDVEMMQGVERRLKETGADRAVIITGGFHADPFREHFSGSDHGYALISPRITSTDDKGKADYVQFVMNSFVKPVKTSTYAMSMQGAATDNHFSAEEASNAVGLIEKEIRPKSEVLDVVRDALTKPRSESRLKKTSGGQAQDSLNVSRRSFLSGAGAWAVSGAASSVVAGIFNSLEDEILASRLGYFERTSWLHSDKAPTQEDALTDLKSISNAHLGTFHSAVRRLLVKSHYGDGQDILVRALETTGDGEATNILKAVDSQFLTREKMEQLSVSDRAIALVGLRRAVSALGDLKKGGWALTLLNDTKDAYGKPLNESAFEEISATGNVQTMKLFINRYVEEVMEKRVMDDAGLNGFAPRFTKLVAGTRDPFDGAAGSRQASQDFNAMRKELEQVPWIRRSESRKGPGSSFLKNEVDAVLKSLRAIKEGKVEGLDQLPEGDREQMQSAAQIRLGFLEEDLSTSNLEAGRRFLKTYVMLVREAQNSRPAFAGVKRSESRILEVALAAVREYFAPLKAMAKLWARLQTAFEERFVRWNAQGQGSRVWRVVSEAVADYFGPLAIVEHAVRRVSPIISGGTKTSSRSESRAIGVSNVVRVFSDKGIHRRDFLKTFGVAAVFSLSAAAVKAADSYGVPTAPSKISVKTNDRRLFIQDRRPDGTLGAEYALTMRGMNWSPASMDSNPAVNPTGFRDEFFKWYQTDIPLMAKMGINTVRVYHDFGTSPQAFQVLDMFYKYGIKVIVQVDSPLHGIVADTANISTVVNAYKNHPAILMWTIGNEWDLKMSNGKYYWTFNTLTEAAEWVQTVAQTIKAIDPNHAVSTMIADPHIPGTHALSQEAFPYLNSAPYTKDIVNTMCSAVDVWGLQVYRNKSFMDLFSQWRSITTKPMYIGEFGADSYDHRINAQNYADQAAMNGGLLDETFFDLSAERTNGTAVGASLFEFVDEWWKNGTAGTQEISYESNGGQPDGVNDEEHFGLFTIDRSPKTSATMVADRFNKGPDAVALQASPLLTVSSQDQGNAVMKIGDKTVFVRGGGQWGARGINVFVLDEATGIRVKEYRSFDTYIYASEFASLVNYLNGLPNGSIVVFAIADEGGFWKEPWAAGGYENPAAASLKTLLSSSAWGSTQTGNIRYQSGWVFISKKGAGKLAENLSVAANTTATVSYQPTLSTNVNIGLRTTYTQAQPFQVNSVRRAGSNAEIQFSSVNGLVYQIEYSNDLRTWSVARGGIVAEGAVTTWVDNGAFTLSAPNSVSERFYRVKVTGQVFRSESRHNAQGGQARGIVKFMTEWMSEGELREVRSFYYESVRAKHLGEVTNDRLAVTLRDYNRLRDNKYPGLPATDLLVTAIAEDDGIASIDQAIRAYQLRSERTSTRRSESRVQEFPEVQSFYEYVTLAGEKTLEGITDVKFVNAASSPIVLDQDTGALTIEASAGLLDPQGERHDLGHIGNIKRLEFHPQDKIFSSVVETAGTSTRYDFWFQPALELWVVNSPRRAGTVTDRSEAKPVPSFVLATKFEGRDAPGEGTSSWSRHPSIRSKHSIEFGSHSLASAAAGLSALFEITPQNIADSPKWIAVGLGALGAGLFVYLAVIAVRHILHKQKPHVPDEPAEEQHAGVEEDHYGTGNTTYVDHGDRSAPRSESRGRQRALMSSALAVWLLFSELAFAQGASQLVKDLQFGMNSKKTQAMEEIVKRLNPEEGKAPDAEILAKQDAIVKLLLSIMRNPSGGEVGQKAAIAAAAFGPSALDPLMAEIEGNISSGKPLAVRAIGLMGTPAKEKAVPLFMEILADSKTNKMRYSQTLINQVIVSLALLGRPFDETVFEGLAGALRQVKDRNLQLEMALRLAEDPVFRKNYCKDLVPVLAKGLGLYPLGSQKRLQILNALVEINEPISINMVLSVLDFPDHEDRENAAKALREIPSPSQTVVNVLFEKLRTERSPSVAALICMAFEKYCLPATLEPLEKYVANLPRQNFDVPKYRSFVEKKAVLAVEAIKTAKPFAALPGNKGAGAQALPAWMNDSTPLGKWLDSAGISAEDLAAVSSLENPDLSSDEKASVMEKIVSVGRDPKLIQAVIIVLTTPSSAYGYKERSAAARALSMVRPLSDAVLAAIIGSLEKDPSGTVLKADCNALGEFGVAAQSALPVLKRFLEQLPNNSKLDGGEREKPFIEKAAQRAIAKIEASLDSQQGNSSATNQFPREVKRSESRHGTMVQWLDEQTPEEIASLLIEVEIAKMNTDQGKVDPAFSMLVGAYNTHQAFTPQELGDARVLLLENGSYTRKFFLNRSESRSGDEDMTRDAPWADSAAAVNEMTEVMAIQLERSSGRVEVAEVAGDPQVASGEMDRVRAAQFKRLKQLEREARNQDQTPRVLIVDPNEKGPASSFVMAQSRFLPVEKIWIETRDGRVLGYTPTKPGDFRESLKQRFEERGIPDDLSVIAKVQLDMKSPFRSEARSAAPSARRSKWISELARVESELEGLDRDRSEILKESSAERREDRLLALNTAYADLNWRRMQLQRYLRRSRLSMSPAVAAGVAAGAWGVNEPEFFDFMSSFLLMAGWKPQSGNKVSVPFDPDDALYAMLSDLRSLGHLGTKAPLFTKEELALPSVRSESPKHPYRSEMRFVGDLPELVEDHLISVFFDPNAAALGKSSWVVEVDGDAHFELTPAMISAAKVFIAKATASEVSAPAALPSGQGTPKDFVNASAVSTTRARTENPLTPAAAVGALKPAISPAAPAGKQVPVPSENPGKILAGIKQPAQAKAGKPEVSDGEFDFSDVMIRTMREGIAVEKPLGNIDSKELPQQIQLAVRAKVKTAGREHYAPQDHAVKVDRRAGWVVFALSTAKDEPATVLLSLKSNAGKVIAGDAVVAAAQMKAAGSERYDNLLKKWESAQPSAQDAVAKAAAEKNKKLLTGGVAAPARKQSDRRSGGLIDKRISSPELRDQARMAWQNLENSSFGELISGGLVGELGKVLKNAERVQTARGWVLGMTLLGVGAGLGASIMLAGLMTSVTIGLGVFASLLLLAEMGIFNQLRPEVLDVISLGDVRLLRPLIQYILTEIENKKLLAANSSTKSGAVEAPLSERDKVTAEALAAQRKRASKAGEVVANLSAKVAGVDPDLNGNGKSVSAVKPPAGVAGKLGTGPVATQAQASKVAPRSESRFEKREPKKIPDAATVEALLIPERLVLIREYYDNLIPAWLLRKLLEKQALPEICDQLEIWLGLPVMEVVAPETEALRRLIPGGHRLLARSLPDDMTVMDSSSQMSVTVKNTVTVGGALALEAGLLERLLNENPRALFYLLKGFLGNTEGPALVTVGAPDLVERIIRAMTSKGVVDADEAEALRAVIAMLEEPTNKLLRVEVPEAGESEAAALNRFTAANQGGVVSLHLNNAMLAQLQGGFHFMFAEEIGSEDLLVASVLGSALKSLADLIHNIPDEKLRGDLLTEFVQEHLPGITRNGNVFVINQLAKLAETFVQQALIAKSA